MDFCYNALLKKLPSDALDHTTSWIKSVLEEVLSATIPMGQPQGKGQQPAPGPFQVLNAAFLRILTWDYNKSPLPEVTCVEFVFGRERVRCNLVGTKTT